MIGTQLSARAAAICAVLFGAICLWFALDAFTSPAELSNPDQLSGGASFAGFWAFLAVVAFAIGCLSWRFTQQQRSQ
ncbi:MAG: hypothetical protein E6H63_13430 [Betaproteobacteria bacterium]|nr:MAG: hypothetical protein E6H63_13430 [Betaproteobacteria bacterium]TMH41249.1 MAG: hypothetical protein E6H54_16820 [Betaproteobacteria bacterium]